uniref:UDP-glycosyltransferase 1 n=1 Tax=Linum usitatissimum TaxID=4006 RepID=I2BHB9_LINUS|nr:UDP-glycosyltransferase 1 [Linum usitatissimum]
MATEETNDGRRHRKPHAIVIPFPLQGHVIPAVHLAIKLASEGFTITFINTHYIHHKITSSSAAGGAGDDFFAGVRETGLDIRYKTVSDGKPLGFDRSLNHNEFMASVMQVLPVHVEELVAGMVAAGEEEEEKVSCLVADTFFVWSSKVAKKFGLVYVSVWTEPALVFTLYHHVHLLRQNGHFGCQGRRDDPIDYIPGVKIIEPKDTPSSLQGDDDETVIDHQVVFGAIQDAKSADFILANTIQELEQDTLAGLKLAHEAQVYAIGPIFPTEFTKSLVSTSLWSESDCTRWLNSKPLGSVLYVSFGTFAHMAKPDLVEIARGFALSGVSFLWTLRNDIVSSNDPDPLPFGFREEVSDRAMIVGWCNQKEVLAHTAIGGFLTHCGWNSVLESTWCGVPMLCFPLFVDQFTNRKLVVDDWKVGINLISDRAVVTKEEVAMNANHLMVGKSRNELKERINGLQKILVDAIKPSGSSKQNFARFVRELNDTIIQRKESW